MTELDEWNDNDWIKEFDDEDLNVLVDKGRNFINMHNKFKNKNYSAYFEISKSGEKFKLVLSMKKNGEC